MSQGTAPSRSIRRRTAGLALAALALPAVLALAGCSDTTNAAAPALAAATGAATDSAAEYGAVCARVESAWAKFVPEGSWALVDRVSTSGRKYQVYKLNLNAYYRVSVGLYDSLTGNREFKLTYDIDSLAASASNIYNDPSSNTPPKQDLAALKQGAAVVAKDCGTTLTVPA